MNINQFDFNLPQHLIAQKKSKQSQLLVFTRKTQSIQIVPFESINSLLNTDDYVIMNDTKVISSRLYGKKKTGGMVEIFIEKIQSDQSATVITKSNHRLPMPITLELESGHSVLIEETNNALLKQATFNINGSLIAYLDEFGATPLPPYIKPETRIDSNYQTCYAKHLGAVAAPTAGLHFTDQIINDLPCQHDFVTLHVGLGTFLPVKETNITKHLMHHEEYTISQPVIDRIKQTKENDGRIIAVGTTSVRTLEDTWRQSEVKAGTRSTDIYIYPGYHWGITDGIITNFHLPKSTLFMLVCAAIGVDAAHTCYQTAIEHELKFYSYGDAMLII